MKRCSCIIIDDESSHNIESSERVEKIFLITQPHPHPYYIQWINPCGMINVTRIEILMDIYKGIANFDIVPMQTCLLLFSKPWTNENQFAQ